jgi:hypothetical protein
MLIWRVIIGELDAWADTQLLIRDCLQTTVNGKSPVFLLITVIIRLVQRGYIIGVTVVSLALIIIRSGVRKARRDRNVGSFCVRDMRAAIAI